MLRFVPTLVTAAPDRLGEYEILGELGRGAMGVVWRGRKAAMPDREVAIKEVPVGPDPADRNRKLREARTLLRVDSVHIVALHDVFEVPERGSLCFVMERLRSETLRDRATSLGAGMEVDDAIETLDAILDALEAAHGATDETGTPRPVVHRDIKPENVGYQAWRGGEIVKVMDFGVARIAELEGDAKETLAAYTPAYAAPEVILGQPAGPPADLFAVGLVGWELLVGKHPFSDARGQLGPPVLLQARIAQEPVPPLPDALLPRIPEAIVDLLEDLCARDPALRPTAHEARRRLAAAKSSTASQRVARRAPVAPSTRGSRRKLAVIVGGVVAIAAGTFLVWSLVMGKEPERPAPVAARRPTASPATSAPPPAPATSAPATAVRLEVAELGAPMASLGGGSFIDRTEVTVGDYDRCILRGDCEPHPPGCAVQRGERFPVNCVTFELARAFCSAHGKRLPTDDEWDAAARGEDERSFPWGEEEPDCTRADFTPTGSVRDSCGGIGPSPVGSRPAGATPEGVDDLAGNLWEWVDDPASPNAATRPVRGGTWGSPADEIRTSSRSTVGRNEARPGVGFRCAR